MSTRRWIPPVVVGDCRFDSGLFSNRWRLSRGGESLADLRRYPSRHTSSGSLADGTKIDLTPDGWGSMELTADGTTIGRIDRRSWWGRRWEVTGDGFACDLTSDPMPRRWTFRIGGEPIGYLAGTMWSYNRLFVHADVSIPVHALILSWQVLARPWEAAAATRSVVADRVTTHD